MGLFRWAKKKVGQVLKIVGDHIPGSFGIELWSIGTDMELFNSSYNPSTATASETVDFTVLCKEASDDATKKYTPIIEKLVQWGKDGLKQACDTYQTVMPLEKIDMASITSCFNGITADYQDFIAHEFSVENPRFAKILKIEKKEEREENIQQYKKEVIKQASDRIQNEVLTRRNEALKKMIETVDEYLQVQIENVKMEQEELRELNEKRGDLTGLVEIYKKQITKIAYLECIRSQTF